MEVHKGLDQLGDLQQGALTIGTFDGVHLGHQQILRQLKEAARQAGGPSVLITFDPHPREVLPQEGQTIRLLNTPEEKIRLLEQQDIDHLVIVPFTETFSRLSAEAYIREFLVHYFRPRAIIIGYDHRFGYQRSGNIEVLLQGQEEFGYRVQEIPLQLLREISISSTRIRHYLEEGQISLANELLGYSYMLGGTVERGDRIGHELGFPTANIAITHPKKLIPAQGVYAVRVSLPSIGLSAKGMLNIGMRPTFGGRDLRVEVHIFQFEREIYGQFLEVSFQAFLRNDIRFKDPQALKEQLFLDQARALECLQ